MQACSSLLSQLLGFPRSSYKVYEGLSLPNQNGRKLGVFGRKLEGSHYLFIVIVLHITGNETIMFKICFFPLK